jgi:hypothetical protein
MGELATARASHRSCPCWRTARAGPDGFQIEPEAAERADHESASCELVLEKRVVARTRFGPDAFAVLIDLHTHFSARSAAAHAPYNA